MLHCIVIQMNDGRLQTFLDVTTRVVFAPTAEERYRLIDRTVRRSSYRRLNRFQRAVVPSSLPRVSGYSRHQLTWLVKRGADRTPLLKRCRGSRTNFATRHTLANVPLVVQTNSLLLTLSEPATKRLMEACTKPVRGAALRVPGCDLGGARVQPGQRNDDRGHLQPLDALTVSSSDNEAAKRFNEVRGGLLKLFSSRSKSSRLIAMNATTHADRSPGGYSSTGCLEIAAPTTSYAIAFAEGAKDPRTSASCALKLPYDSIDSERAKPKLKTRGTIPQIDQPSRPPEKPPRSGSSMDWKLLHFAHGSAVAPLAHAANEDPKC